MLELLDLITDCRQFLPVRRFGKARIQNRGLLEVVGGLLKIRQKLVVVRQKKTQYGAQTHSTSPLANLAGIITRRQRVIGGQGTVTDRDNSRLLLRISLSELRLSDFLDRCGHYLYCTRLRLP